MTITKIESVKSYCHVWIRSSFTGLLTPVNLKLYGRVFVSNDPLHPLEEGWVRLSNAQCRYQYKVSQRENNPFDEIPGVGYLELKKQGAYIPHKFYHLIHTSFGMQHLVLENNFPGINGRLITTNELSRFSWDWTSTGEFYREYFFHQKIRDRAIVNLYASLGKRTKFNGGVVIGEMRETMNLLGKSCTTLLLAYRAIRRGRVKEALGYFGDHVGLGTSSRLLNRSQLNQQRKKRGEKPISKSEYASSAWLELQFGWKPLMKDISDYISYLDSLSSSNTGEQWLSFSGYARDTATFDKFYSFVNVNGLRYSSKLRESVSEQYSLTATFKPSSPLLQKLNQVGLVNPASIAWELVPFSFVLDWFLPIGDWIESFTAHAGLDLIECTPSIKTVAFYEIYDISIVQEGHTSKWTSPNSIEGYKEEFVRIPTDGNPIPPFPVLSASLEDILQPWKLITSLALFKAIKGGK